MENLSFYVAHRAWVLKTPVLLAPLPSPAESVRPFATTESVAPTREVRRPQPRFNPDATAVIVVEKTDRNADPRILCGRALTNDVVINHDSISKQHAFFESRGEQWLLTDLDSRNGTFIDESRLAGGSAVALPRRCALRFGECAMTFFDAEAFAKLLDELRRSASPE